MAIFRRHFSAKTVLLRTDFSAYKRQLAGLIRLIYINRAINKSQDYFPTEKYDYQTA